MGQASTVDQRPAPIDAEGIATIWRRNVGTAATSDAVYATLREAILHGFLSPGARLGEEELSALLGVSRTPIRESLLRLEVEQLAVRIQRRGLEVRRISETEIHEVYEVRAHLASLAMELAATRITSADLARLRWLNDQLREAHEAGDLRRSVALGDEFHDCLYRASGNGVLVQMLDHLRVRIRRFPGFTYQYGGRAEAIVAEHDELIRHLATGDIEQAIASSVAHSRNAKQARLALRNSVDPEAASETSSDQ